MSRATRRRLSRAEGLRGAWGAAAGVQPARDGSAAAAGAWDPLRGERPLPMKCREMRLLGEGLMVGGQAPFAAGGASPTSHGQVRASAQPPCRGVRGLTLPRAARAGTDPAVAGAYLHAGQRSRLGAAMNLARPPLWWQADSRTLCWVVGQAANSRTVGAAHGYPALNQVSRSTGLPRRRAGL